MSLEEDANRWAHWRDGKSEIGTEIIYSIKDDDD